MLKNMDLKVASINQTIFFNQIQQIVDEAEALNRAMDQLSQEITGNEEREKVTRTMSMQQIKQVYDEAVDRKQALDKSYLGKT